MIPWKTYWSAGGAIGVGGAAALMSLLDAHPVLGIIVFVAAVVLFMMVARRVVNGAVMFSRVNARSRQVIVKLLDAAAAVHGVIGVLWVFQPGRWGLWAAALVVVGVLEYWIARAHEYMLTQLKAPEEVRAEKEQEKAREAEQKQAQLEANRQDKPVRQLRTAMTNAGYDTLDIVGWKTIHRGGRPVGITYTVRVTSTGKNSSKTSLGGGDAEAIAIALSRLLGVPLHSDWVQFRKTPAAGTYTLTVLTEDVMQQVYAYVDRLEWHSISDPALIGYDVEGSPYRLRLDAHGSNTGQTRSGKSSLINVMLAHLTLCHDAVVWTCGVEKLFDLVGPWIEPYLNTDFRIPFDWIASGPKDTATMLAAAMTVARWRQAQPHSARGAFKKIIVLLDEASFALTITTIKATYQGRMYTMSELAEMIVKGAGSAGVFLHLATQRSTNNNLGDCGGDINANLMWQTVFRSKDEAEVGRVTGDYKLPAPRHKGEYLVEPGNGDDVIRLKSPYIQEIDPQREKLHDGATIADIAWARRHFHVELDPGSAAVAGAAYANRHLYATDELMAYLAGVMQDIAAVVAPDMPDTNDDNNDVENDLVSQELARLDAEVAELLGNSTPGPASGRGASTVATIAEPRTLNDHIVAIIEAADGTIAKTGIISALRDRGVDTTDQVVTNALTRLVNAGAIERVARGQYTSASSD